MSIGRDNIEQGIIGGLIGGCLILVAKLALRAGVSRTELFAFVGGLLGLLIPIVGTIWIEDRKRAQARKDDALRIIEPLRDIIRQIDALSILPAEEGAARARKIPNDLDALAQLVQAYPPGTARRTALFNRLHQAQLRLQGDATIASYRAAVLYPDEAPTVAPLYAEIHAIAHELLLDYMRDA